jgi:hypothetical protein
MNVICCACAAVQLLVLQSTACVYQQMFTVTPLLITCHTIIMLTNEMFVNATTVCTCMQARALRHVVAL